MFARWRRRRRAREIDPFGVGEPWRRYVQGALQAQARYQRAVGDVASGPLRERLEEIGRRIDEALQECWRVARRGDALEDAVSALDLPGTRARLATSASGAGGMVAEGAVVASLQAQVDAGERMAALVAQAQEHLARLEAGLGQAVATAVELATRHATSADASGLGDEVDHLVDDLAALGAALEETQALGA